MNRLNLFIVEDAPPSTPVEAFDHLIELIDQASLDRAYDIAHEDGGPNCPDFEDVVERAAMAETLRLLRSYRAQLDAEIEYLSTTQEALL